MPSPSYRFVLLCSSAFSGSTLLAFLMNAHPEIVSIGELTGLISSVDSETYQCSCGNPIKSCPFWFEVTKEMKRCGHDFDVSDFRTALSWTDNRILERLLTGSLRSVKLERIRDRVAKQFPGYRTRMSYYVSRNVALADTLADLTGASVVFDTSKYRKRIRHLLEHSELDLYFVHLVRDVRGVVLSHKKRYPTTNVATFTRQWIRYNQNTQLELDSLPTDRRMMIRYEDLCTDTSAILQKLHRFCRVEPMVHTDLESVSHHIIGNPMRLSNTASIRLDDRWKTDLTDEQLATIGSLSKYIRRAYGYEDYP